MIGHDGDEPGQTYELNIEMQDEPVKGQILVKKTGDMLVGFETRGRIRLCRAEAGL